MNLPYRDRSEAAGFLAEALRERFSDRDDIVVLALPRGGVPVGEKVAAALDAPLDVLVVRKIGVPDQEELAMGAIATGGVRVSNPDVLDSLGISEEDIEDVTAREREELERRERAYRDDRPPQSVEGRCVILVDDGLATGATMRAAVSSVRELGATSVVVAVPVAPPETISGLRREADEVVCPATPEPFLGIGRWYEDFGQVSDDEVRRILERQQVRR